MSGAWRKLKHKWSGTVNVIDSYEDLPRLKDLQSLFEGPQYARWHSFRESEDSRYVTGNTLFVDGGGHINGTPWAPEMPEEMSS